MASEPQQSGADRIRSLKTDDDIFKAFDSYPWTKDKNFMSGLYAILGNPSTTNPQASLNDMATHARIFYYTQKIGVTIDFARYTSWLASHPEHQPPDVLPEEYIKGPPDSGTPALDWQKAAPKADLWINKEAAAAAEGDQPSYPMGFAEMIKLLQEGKPVPGIKSIPNTVVRDPSVKPVGARAVPRKPWERDDPPEAPVLDITKALDTDFPEVDSDIQPGPQS